MVHLAARGTHGDDQAAPKPQLNVVQAMQQPCEGRRA